MASDRLKGQEVEFILVQDNKPLDTITAIKSAELTYELTQSSEGFLGETTDRKDSVFTGIKGNLELQIETRAIFTLIQSIIDKARRRTPGVRINLKMTLNLPGGDRVRVIVPDCAFGDIPIGFGGRAEFVTVKLDYSASIATTIG